MNERPLSAYELWMVQSNLRYVETESLAVVVDRLRVNGYNRVADAVEREGSVSRQ